MVRAGATFSLDRLPEHFAGYDRDGDEPPVSVPASARPQAWPAATPVFAAARALASSRIQWLDVMESLAAELPSWADGLNFTGVPACERRWEVRVTDGGAAAAEAFTD